MIDYEKRVKALTCGNDGKLPCHNNECPYWVDKWHGIGLCNVIKKDADAADAIEALQAEVKRLKEANEELREKQTYIDHYGTEWMTSAKDVPNYAYEHGYADGMAEVKAQLPKQGKWIWDDKRCIYVCSICGSPKVRENMDRQIIKEQAYCHFCGAKMEAQDDKV